ncbi:unnamed protein product [Mytilus coruscus]|uniref:Ig-like domain-containing protein n=1 Tax=Mytilus coruscus TaxID=42192 RepID=A0A6J8ATH1_MYTCO|nr:unnamed protein product [Mytilus coruscus]
MSFSVYWTIEDIPFTCIFGSNVTLFCNTSALGLQKATWMKQSDVIFHQGLSFYPDKYSGEEVYDGSYLIIMNATESDFNTSYTCLSDVHSYEEVLVINSSSFVCLPQNTNSSWTITGRNISVHLNLDRFFPVPNCTTKLNDDILITNQQESVYQENWFYHGTINITSHSTVDICGGNLTVVCMFGCSNSDVIATEFLQDCSVNGTSEYWFRFLGIVSVAHEEIIPFTEVVKSKKSGKKETENEAHSFKRRNKKERTQTWRQYVLNDCFNLNRKK